MQIQRYELNGNFVEMIVVTRDPKEVANLAWAMSGEDPGFICVAGENLDAENQTDRQIRCVAVSGQVINQSLYDE